MQQSRLFAQCCGHNIKGVFDDSIQHLVGDGLDPDGVFQRLVGELIRFPAHQRIEQLVRPTVKHSLMVQFQNAAGAGDAAPAVLHYCTRAAAKDGVLPRIQALAASAQPPVELIVHDAEKNQYFRPQDLLRHGKALDIWLCGPAGLGQAVREQAQREAGWHLHQEAFQLR